MEFEDKTLICRDCNQEFKFTAGEQEFFAAKQLQNVPKRCPNCRILVRAQRDGKDVSSSCEVNCATCGALTRVPFRPTRDLPVYCQTCKHSQKKDEREQRSPRDQQTAGAPTSTD